MNTTTNTRGVSEAMVEQIEAAFEQWENDASVISLFAAFKAGVAYAAAPPAQPAARVPARKGDPDDVPSWVKHCADAAGVSLYIAGWNNCLDALSASPAPSEGGKGVTPDDDVRWLLDFPIHSEFDHDREREAAACRVCQRLKAIKTRLAAAQQAAR